MMEHFYAQIHARRALCLEHPSMSAITIAHSLKEQTLPWRIKAPLEVNTWAHKLHKCSSLEVLLTKGFNSSLRRSNSKYQVSTHTWQPCLLLSSRCHLPRHLLPLLHPSISSPGDKAEMKCSLLVPSATGSSECPWKGCQEPNTSTDWHTRLLQVSISTSTSWMDTGVVLMTKRKSVTSMATKTIR